MAGEGLVARLIEAAYAAPFEEAPFSELVALCQEHLDAAYVGFAMKDHAGAEPSCAPMAALHIGQTRLTEALVSHDVLLRSEFYSDCLTQGRLGAEIGALVERNENGSCVFSVFYEKEQRQRAKAQLALISRLGPHLDRALTMCRLRSDHRSELELSRRLLDRVPCAAFIVDRVGRLLRTNARAEEMLRQADGIGIDQNGLCASHPADSNELLREIAAPRKAREPLVFLRRPSGAQPLIALVGSLVEGEHRVLVLVRDPELEISVPASAIARVLGTTPAEARLVERLVRGATLKEAAARLHISEHTARTQLKAVFGKTGTRSQADLLRRVLVALPSSLG